MSDENTIFSLTVKKSGTSRIIITVEVDNITYSKMLTYVKSLIAAQPPVSRE